MNVLDDFHIITKPSTVIIDDIFNNSTKLFQFFLVHSFEILQKGNQIDQIYTNIPFKAFNFIEFKFTDHLGIVVESMIDKLFNSHYPFIIKLLKWINLNIIANKD